MVQAVAPVVLCHRLMAAPAYRPTPLYGGHVLPTSREGPCGPHLTRSSAIPHPTPGSACGLRAVCANRKGGAHVVGSAASSPSYATGGEGQTIAYGKIASRSE